MFCLGLFIFSIKIIECGNRWKLRVIRFRLSGEPPYCPDIELFVHRVWERLPVNDNYLKISKFSLNERLVHCVAVYLVLFVFVNISIL